MNKKERLRFRERKRCFWFVHAPGIVGAFGLGRVDIHSFHSDIVYSERCFAWEHVLKH